MPWSSTYYPASMKNLPLPVREKALQVIPGTTQLFEEPGTLEQVAVQARNGFRRWLVGATAGHPA